MAERRPVSPLLVIAGVNLTSRVLVGLCNVKYFNVRALGRQAAVKMDCKCKGVKSLGCARRDRCLRSAFSLHIPYYPYELLDRFHVFQSLNDTLVIQTDVVMHKHVPKPGKQPEPVDEVGFEPVEFAQ